MFVLSLTVVVDSSECVSDSLVIFPDFSDVLDVHYVVGYSYDDPSCLDELKHCTKLHFVSQ